MTWRRWWRVRREADVRLLSWNIQWARGVDGIVDPARISQVIRSLGEPDVICLQEVSHGFEHSPGIDGGDQFAEIASHWPGYAAFAAIATDWPAATPGGRRRRFGNLTLTRLPTGPVLRHLLPWPADEGLKSMQRAALELTVQAPFGPLRVTNTHLEYYSARQRQAQVQRLRELHAEAVDHAVRPRSGEPQQGPFDAVPRGTGALWTGDFNFEPGGPDHRAVLAPFADATTPRLVDAWTWLYPGAPHAPTVGVHDKVLWPEPAFTCDFAFASEDLARRLRSVRVDPHTQASDHQPLLIELA